MFNSSGSKLIKKRLMPLRRQSIPVICRGKALNLVQIRGLKHSAREIKIFKEIVILKSHIELEILGLVNTLLFRMFQGFKLNHCISCKMISFESLYLPIFEVSNIS